MTVGTAHFDPLIKEMDRLVQQGIVQDKVVAQIGRGSYIPKNFPFFRFMKSLNAAYDWADVIVSTGGAGTTIECVKRGLRLVVVENRTLMEGHQAQLIGMMSRRKHLVWCRELSELSDCIATAKVSTFAPFIPDRPQAHVLIEDLLRSL
ncbi:MAG: glycosyltransferase [Candidatus Thorarchaeota archaeon]